MTVVLDANVLLAAFGTGGTCREVVETCLLAHHICLSEFIFDEFRRKLVDKFGMPVGDVEADVQFLRRHCSIVSPEMVDSTACRDQNDLPVLGTLVAADADCLVTGDRDLLDLRQFSGHPILSPRQFLQQAR